jgi:two-component system, cell cycle response regulator DivK
MKADAELKRTPIMAVTAYAARGDEERIRDAGAEGYVSKPISVVRFVEAVRALLEVTRDEAETAADEPASFPGESRGPGAEGEETEDGEEKKVDPGSSPG